ncbi:extracellular solute-binding protein, partial [Clostridium perfringens]
MKRAFKFISTLCVLALMLTVLAACGGSKSPAATDGSKATTDTPKDETSKDIPTLTWWTIGGQVPNNFSKAVDAMNAYTAEKIGVKVDIKVASWGEWDTKMNTIVNTGEPFDIMFTNSGKY